MSTLHNPEDTRPSLSEEQRTQDFFNLLQGKKPDYFQAPRKNIPHLDPDQAWTVIRFLKSQYYEIADRVERCNKCATLFNAWTSGEQTGNGNKWHCSTCLKPGQ